MKHLAAIIATIFLMSGTWSLAAEATDIVCLDGDTFRANIDIGFGIVLKDRVVRIHGFDAWENSRHRRTLDLAPDQWEQEIARGQNAERALNGMLKSATKVRVVETMSKDPYGRLVLDVYADQTNVAESMRARGHERRPEIYDTRK